MCDECGWRETLDTISDLLGDLDTLPERATDFAESVREKLESMANWIEENEHVTKAQDVAIGNMAAGIDKWTEF